MGTYSFIRNISAALRIQADNDVWQGSAAGAPTSGTSGTGVGIAGPGSVYTNISTGIQYVNTNTKASPTWSPVPTGGADGVLILPTATVPAQTADGSVVWDSDSDLLTVGDGSSRKVMADTSSTQTLAGKTLTTPVIGVATGTSLAVTGLITSSGTAGIGYATGAGGTVTQTTNRSTGVTLSKICGSIQTDTTSLAAEAAAEFTVTNTLVAIGDVVVVSQRSGSNGGNTNVFVSTVAAGSFAITVANNNAAGGAAETGAIIINFAVIKAVTA